MKFKLRPTIFSNGLILISVPLIFEFTFAGTLFVLQQDYERKLQKQITANEIIAHTNEMWLAVMDLTTASLKKKIFSDWRYTTRFQISKIDDEYKILTKLVEQEDPAQLPKLRLMREICDGLADITNDFQGADSTGGVVGVRGNYDQFRHLSEMIRLLGQDMVGFRQPWQRRTEEARAAMTSAHNTINAVTLAGVIASIIMAALLFTYFMRNIYGGIRNLMENTFRFARKEALLPALEGTDELAQLDRIFHDMAKSVDAAEVEQNRLQQLKQDFFQMITHDMRTPLSSIGLSIEALQNGMAGEVSDEALPTLARAERSVSHLMNLVSDLLDLETAESHGLVLQIEKFDVRQTIDQVVQLVQPVAKRSEIELQIVCTAGEFYADRTRFLRVLTNLVANAIKFSPEKGTVSITAKIESERLRVSVSDQGRGVPKEHQQRIFDKFQQVEKNDSVKKSGSGLGLSIAKAFIEAHGGAIGVESKAEQGSTFWFVIPDKSAKKTD
ncbi:hypothetical protein BH10CYA1_BH10CYA1_30070 [soil metagenome]